MKGGVDRVSTVGVVACVDQEGAEAGKMDEGHPEVLSSSTGGALGKGQEEHQRGEKEAWEGMTHKGEGVGQRGGYTQ